MVGPRPCFAHITHSLANQFYKESKGNNKIKNDG